MKLDMVPPVQITEKKEGKTVFPYLKEGQGIPCLNCITTECKLTIMGSADWDIEHYICPVCNRLHECKVEHDAEAMKKGEFIPKTISIVRVWWGGDMDYLEISDPYLLGFIFLQHPEIEENVIYETRSKFTYAKFLKSDKLDSIIKSYYADAQIKAFSFAREVKKTRGFFLGKKGEIVDYGRDRQH
jgi:hypothetical protein